MKYTVVIILSALMFSQVYAHKQNVIFDCDLGRGIDHAFAVALLLTSQEELEVLGITFGHGNTPGRDELAMTTWSPTVPSDVPS